VISLVHGRAGSSGPQATAQPRPSVSERASPSTSGPPQVGGKPADSRPATDGEAVLGSRQASTPSCIVRRHGRGRLVRNAPIRTPDPLQAVELRQRRNRVDDELVSGAEIGRRLGVSRERVRQWASNPKYRFPDSLARVGGSKIWKWPDIQRWAEARRLDGRRSG
jgi:hypothetical protein